jgi:polynucleotide 5'-kinase involved in rRNA processing
LLIFVEWVRGKEMVNFNNNYDELAMPGDWIPIVQKLQSQDGTVIVLGKSDSGKTSLIKLLTYFLVKRNRNIGIIDLDTGQSTLGPPATIAMSTVDKKKLKDGNIPIERFFRAVPELVLLFLFYFGSSFFPEQPECPLRHL